MNNREFNKLIEQQISTLSRERQLGLAIKICKILFFDYQKFAEISQWGNPDLLFDGINLCEKMFNGKPEIHSVKDLIPLIYSVTPDTEEFENELGSYALNASASVHETLEFLIDVNPNHIVNTATYYMDTIDLKIRIHGNMTEDEIDSHPLMLNAREFLLSESR